MLLSTKDQGLGRRRRSYSHGHVYALSKTARSSKLSLLSAITSQSSGSNESSSTVTQESYNKSKSQTSKKKRPSKRRKDPQRSKTPPLESVEEAISEGDEPQDEVDVFEFLVEDDSPQADNGQASSERISTVDDTLHENDALGQSPHSDSGISMDEGSMVLGQTIIKPLLPMLPEHQRRHSNETLQLKFDWKWPDVPKPQHHALISTDTDHHMGHAGNLSPNFNHDMSSPNTFCFTPESPSSRRASWPAYHLLASDVVQQSAEAPATPLKSFARTAQWLLLELQNEVAELENELTRLDSCCDRHDAGASVGSSDHRCSWQWHQYPSELRPLKADVVRRLHLKLQHYYQLLLMSQKVQKLKSDSGDSSKQIKHFRQWLKGADIVPDSTKETLLNFVSDEQDLIVLQSFGGEPDTKRSYDNIGRIVLCVTLFISALSLLVVSDIRIKIIITAQLLGLTVVLCIPRRV